MKRSRSRERGEPGKMRRKEDLKRLIKCLCFLFHTFILQLCIYADVIYLNPCHRFEPCFPACCLRADETETRLCYGWVSAHFWCSSATGCPNQHTTGWSHICSVSVVKSRQTSFHVHCCASVAVIVWCSFSSKHSFFCICSSLRKPIKTQILQHFMYSASHCLFFYLLRHWGDSFAAMTIFT